MREGRISSWIWKRCRNAGVKQIPTTAYPVLRVLCLDPLDLYGQAQGHASELQVPLCFPLAPVTYLIRHGACKLPLNLCLDALSKPRLCGFGPTMLYKGRETLPCTTVRAHSKARRPMHIYPSLPPSFFFMKDKLTCMMDPIETFVSEAPPLSILSTLRVRHSCLNPRGRTAVAQCRP